MYTGAQIAATTLKVWLSTEHNGILHVNLQVDVERPSPCCRRRSERSSYDGTKYSTQSPNYANTRDVATTFLFRCTKGKVVEDAARIFSRTLVMCFMRPTYPRKIPVPPTPAIALPMMRASMLGAAPQSAEAASKRTMLPINSILRLKILYKAALSIRD